MLGNVDVPMKDDHRGGAQTYTRLVVTAGREHLIGFVKRCVSKCYTYAVQRWGLKCHWDFSTLSAVRSVYRYVIQLKARIQNIINP